MASFHPLCRWLPPAAAAGVALAVSACTPGPKPGTPAAAPAPVNVGAPLYAADPAPAPPAPPRGPEPIVVQQATLQFDEKITLAFQVDGDLELVATPLDPKEKLDPKDPRYAGRLVPRPRDKSWMHVRLVEDETIRENQILAQLDDSQVTIQLQSLKGSVQSAEDAAKEGDSSVAETAKALQLTDQSGGTKMEMIRYRVELAQARVSHARTKMETVRYQGEYAVTTDKWQRHKIYSPFNGKVVRIIKSPGEYVKAGDPVLEVQNTSRFRVEGKLDRQEAEKVKRYVPVTVEPVRSVGPEPYTARQRREVTGVAVTAHPGRPRVVSASNDGTALVWDVTAADKGQHVLPHPFGTEVRAVAATGPKAEQHLVATGGSDGKVRVWDLTDPAQLPDKPAAEFEEAHPQAVTAAAFSPDGRFLATAAGREVILWDVAAKKKRYAFPAEHKDDVKAMRFTPQATLVTVCRDKTLRVWTVGADGATARTLDHRSGAVDVLGVSADGGRVLFDQDPTRIDVVNLADGRTTGSLLNTGGGLRFAGLALFSPDDKFVVTGAGDADTKGELQLWSVPAGGRGSERRRLVTQYRAAVTCAAFSPDPAHRFVAVGTQSGVTHFWALPDPNEQASLKGRVISVSPNDARTAQVRVEVENADGRLTDLLQDRGAATIIIDPSAKPEPPALPAAPPQPLPQLNGAGAVRPLPAGQVVPAAGVAGK